MDGVFRRHPSIVVNRILREMKRYFIRRLLGLIPTLFVISVIVFGLTRVLPGDPARLLAATEEGYVDPEVLRVIEERHGLDQPLAVQYGDWIWGVVTGDWGRSIITGVEIFPQIISRLSFTVQLAGLAWLTSLIIGIPLGVISAVKRNSISDIAATSLAVSGIALPNFWLGMVMVIMFSVWLGWLPSGGYTSPAVSVVDWAMGMVMPTIVLGTALSGIIMRQTRSALLEVLREDFIRTARAKGLASFSVIVRHAMRNSLLPVVTVASLQLGVLVGGTVVTETVFFLPGLGKFIVDAVISSDYLVIQMGLMVMTLGVVVANFLADIVYGYLDPRIRYN